MNKNDKKLRDLSQIEGTSIERLMEDSVFEGVCKGICMNDGCSYTTDVEPDAKNAYCEVCETQTVASVAVIAGII